MTRRLLAAAAAFLLLACASGAAPVADPGPDPQVTVDEIRATLDDAVVAAKAFGMKHLGHYLELDAHALVDEGFTAPAGIALAVQPDHNGFCLAAEHTGLPDEHEWRVASVDSRRQQPVPGNTCDPGVAPAEVALKTSLATADGGLICLLPPPQPT